MAFDHIGGAEPSTLTFKLATVSMTRNSSKMHQEIMSLGDSVSSLAIAAVVATTPSASTSYGLVVRHAGDVSVQVTNQPTVNVEGGNATPVTVDGTVLVNGNVNVQQVSTVWEVQAAIRGNSTVLQGTSPWVVSGASTVAQASTVWAVQMTQYSTTVNVSSLGGVVIVRSSAADHLVTVYQSTASALQATVTQASTVWSVQQTGYSTQVNVSSVGGVVSIQGNSTVFQGGSWSVSVTSPMSSTPPSSGSSGLVVRQVLAGMTAFASTSALATTSVSVVSSVAGQRVYVTAYTITSTNQTPAHWGFFSSNATLLWPMTLAAISSGVAGANLAVSPPGYLFRTAVADALNFKTAGSTVAGVQMGVSYYIAP